MKICLIHYSNAELLILHHETGKQEKLISQGGRTEKQKY